jgi:hypothetical protein
MVPPDEIAVMHACVMLPPARAGFPPPSGGIALYDIGGTLTRTADAVGLAGILSAGQRETHSPRRADHG